MAHGLHRGLHSGQKDRKGEEGRWRERPTHVRTHKAFVPTTVCRGVNVNVKFNQIPPVHDLAYFVAVEERNDLRPLRQDSTDIILLFSHEHEHNEQGVYL